MKLRSLLIILVCGVFLFACKNKRKRGTGNRDTTITQKTSFNDLFFDSTYIDEFIEKNPQYEIYSEQLDDFYRHRNFEFAWFDKKGVSEQARNFINLQNNHINEFQDSTLGNPELQRLYDSLDNKTFTPNKQDSTLLKTELLFTTQFFQYASKVYKGSDINAKELGWFIPRKKVDFSALLSAALASKTADPEQYVPQNSQYKKLQEYLGKYIEMQKKETPGDSIPAIAKKAFKKGDSSIAISKIKKRLQLLGDMQPGDTSARFDTTLSLAARNFQRRMGLPTDGVIGNKLIAELNVPISKRIRQLLINIERVRWMPADKDSNYILVNLPEYKMHVYEGGNPKFDMDVIVGSAANSTVIFNGRLKHIVFSPYWNIPESIVKKEITRDMQMIPGYLSKNHMEITSKGGGTPEIRQKPGPWNSLGLVKFLFPNNYNIYFHDTPNRNLFSQNSRGLSHGCIRLGEPKKFAEYLLRDKPEWTSEAIDAAMHQDKEKWVNLDKTVPVFLVYFTAWVDATGSLNFRRDIYGHDEKMSEKLFDN